MFSQKEKSVIYEAFDMYYADYCKTLPSNEELGYITFTKDFEERMKKLIERERKFYYYWTNTVGKRVAMIIISIIISLTTFTFSVKALREPFVNFIVETFEKFSNVIFVSDKSEKDNTIENDFKLVVIEPSYIPDGYEKELNFGDEVVYQARYVNTYRTSSIMYMKSINDGSILQANTENVSYENIVINQYAGIYYSNKGTNTIVFSTEEYLFTVEGTVDKEQIFKIAESIIIK